MVMENLVPMFSKSLFESVEDIGIDVLELGVDSILEDGILREIPIVGTVAKIGKIFVSVRDRNLLKQSVIFIQEFNSGKIDEDKLEKYKQELKNNPQKAEKELGRILIILDRIIDANKTQIVARFFYAYLDGKLTWLEFCEFCDITERLFLSDLNLLAKLYKDNELGSDEDLAYKQDRLISLGLLINDSRTLIGLLAGEADDKIESEFTSLGLKYCALVFGDRCMKKVCK